MGAEAPFRTLVARFPALAQIADRSTRRSIPFVRQLSGTECGAACLAMVLRYYGRSVPIEELRDAGVSGRDGTNARVLVELAALHGLRGRTVSLDLPQLEYLERGAILHWGFEHFVVLDQVRRKRIRIVDPARGRRWVPMAEVGKQFTGVAVLLEPDDAFVPAVDERRPFRHFFKEILTERGTLPWIVMVSVVMQVLGLGPPLLTRALLDRVVPQGDYDLLLVLGTATVFLLAFQTWTSLLRSHLMLFLRTRLDARMTLGFMAHLMSLPLAFFQRRSAGDLLARLNSNSVVREILTGTLLSAILDGSLAFGYLVLLLFGSARLALLTVALTAVQVLLLMATRHRQRQILAQALETQGRSQGLQVEILVAVEELKALGCEEEAVKRWSSLMTAELNLSLKRGRLDAITEAATTAVRTGSSMAMLCVGAYEILSGRLSVGDMMALTAVGAAFMAPLISLASAAARFQLLGAYVERLNDVLRTAPERETSGSVALEGFTGAVTVSDLSFQYSPISPPVVRGATLEIAAGEFLAIVGRSGSGKSTLARLLVGLYTPTAGQICYDGIALPRLNLAALRRRIGIVTQQVHLFAATIRDNIALAEPGAPLERIVHAARLACVHDDIMALPMGYDTPLIDRGSSLSGGQQQRIALARALLRSPSMLVLDEATNQLDAATEQQVLMQLARLACTRIVIAHRLSTIARADRIVTLHAGAIAECGTHHQLLTRNGVYASLVAAQTGHTMH